MEQGNPIWVESLLTDKEYAEQAKIYPGMYSNGNKPPAMFPCEFKWRHRMGSGLPPEEIKIINKRFDEILSKAGLLN
jgi:hypothetical protein